MRAQPSPPRAPERLLPGVDGAVALLALGYGRYLHVTSLNPRFLPGGSRLKVRVRIDPAALPPGRVRALARRLQDVIPGLDAHACGDAAGPLRVPAAAGPAGGAGAEPGVEVAHLLEHTLIELQHAVAGLSRCSGVTCAHREPPDLYDLFVESPSPQVGALCARLSARLVNDLLDGAGSAARLAQVLAVARRLLQGSVGLVTRASALPAVAGDARAADAALRELHRAGFLRLARVGVNFSGLPAYERPAESEEKLEET